MRISLNPDLFAQYKPLGLFATLTESQSDQEFVQPELFLAVPHR